MLVMLIISQLFPAKITLSHWVIPTWISIEYEGSVLVKESKVTADMLEMPNERFAASHFREGIMMLL